MPLNAEKLAAKDSGIEIQRAIIVATKYLQSARSVIVHTTKSDSDKLESAELAGADYIMVTCSSIGSAVEAGAKLIGVPVLRVDQPMADKAVATGKKIGVIATLSTTLEPTADLIQRRAAIAKKKIQLTSKLVEGAFEALLAGDGATHDVKVAASLKNLSRQVDVIVLAHASMARVVESLKPEDKRVPILASPGIAVDYLATVL